jgi:hypothetical protein
VCSRIASSDRRFVCLVKKHRFRQSHSRGRCVKLIVSLLLAVISLSSAREVRAQEQTSAEPVRYHLIQLVDPTTFLEKVNETADQGYRLVAMCQTAGQSLSAIMERVEEPSPHYNYLSIPVRSTNSKYASTGKTKAEVAKQLNAAGAKAYRLRMTLGARPDMAVMELSSDAHSLYAYALIVQHSFGYFSNDEISGLVAAGYHSAATATVPLGGPLLIFERETRSTGAPAGLQDEPQTGPQQRFLFAQNNFVRVDLPEKQLHKWAAEGAHVVDFFGSPMQMMLAMEETIPPSVPVQYMVLKPRNEASPLALHAKMTKVEAADLTRAGQQGFRLLRLSAPVPPFLMEKAPGSLTHYEYQFVSSPRLPDLAEQLNNPSLKSFYIAKVVSTENGLLVIVEKSDAA